jgi:hypothetical protein
MRSRTLFLRARMVDLVALTAAREDNYLDRIIDMSSDATAFTDLIPGRR